jgi:hypothetical protein
MLEPSVAHTCAPSNEQDRNALGGISIGTGKGNGTAVGSGHLTHPSVTLKKDTEQPPDITTASMK